ncbi:MAG: sulfotransferase family protein [Bacteroidales bacterium]|nr:sulfotransferase family protein [Bacteroidales bacterium]
MLAFIHIEKAAGTTINSCLRLIYGINHVDVEPWDNRFDYFSHKDLRKLKKVSPGVISIAGHKVKPYGDLDKFEGQILYYTFLRDPIVRCVSHYQYHINIMGLNIPFDDWIMDEQYQNFQVKKISGEDDIELAKEIISTKVFFAGILEDFTKSVLDFYHLTGIDFSIYQKFGIRKNIARENDIKNKLLSNPKDREKLIQANQLDIELYRYVKELSDKNQKAPLNTYDFTKLNRKPSILKLYLSRLYRNIYYRPLLLLHRKTLYRNNQ